MSQQTPSRGRNSYLTREFGLEWMCNEDKDGNETPNGEELLTLSNGSHIEYYQQQNDTPLVSDQQGTLAMNMAKVNDNNGASKFHSRKDDTTSRPTGQQDSYFVSPVQQRGWMAYGGGDVTPMKRKSTTLPRHLKLGEGANPFDIYQQDSRQVYSSNGGKHRKRYRPTASSEQASQDDYVFNRFEPMDEYEGSCLNYHVKADFKQLNRKALAKPVKPLALTRLATVTKKTLQSFEELSPISSRSTSRRSSISSVDTVKDIETSPQEHRHLECEMEAGYQLEHKPIQNSSLNRHPRSGVNPKLHRTMSDTGAHIECGLYSDRCNTNMRHSASQPFGWRKGNSHPQVSPEITLRTDYSNLKWSLRKSSNKDVESSDDNSTNSLPTPRSLHYITNKLRNQLISSWSVSPSADSTPYNLSRPISPVSEPPSVTSYDTNLSDEGCVLSDCQESPQISPQRNVKKTSLRIPELPQILQKLEHTTPPNQFQQLNAALKPLKPKTDIHDNGRKSDGTKISEDPSTPSTRRRRKLAIGEIPTLDNYSSNGDTDRWKSDPTPERYPQNNLVSPLLRGTVSKESVETPSTGYAGSIVSTESSLSNSSLATSISETVADQGFLHAMEEVSYQPGGVINSNIDSNEKNGKSLKKKSLTWPNGNSGIVTEHYTPNIQSSTSNPMMSGQTPIYGDKIQTSVEDLNSTLDSKTSLNNSGDIEPILHIDEEPIQPVLTPQLQRRKSQKRNRGANTVESTESQEAIKQNLNIVHDKPPLIRIIHQRAVSDHDRFTVKSGSLDSADVTKVDTILRSISLSERENSGKYTLSPTRNTQTPTLGPTQGLSLSESTPNLSKNVNLRLKDISGIKTAISTVSTSQSSTLPRTSKQRDISPTRRKKQQDIRLQVANSMLHTEQSYVQSLETLVKNYYEPLKSPENSGICDPSIVDIMFYKVPEILHNHRLFLRQLQPRVKEWNEIQKIGDIFTSSFTKQSLLDTYTSFINNFSRAKELISKASAKPAFNKFLDDRMRENKEKLSVDDLIIKPVQRIPRYELIIKDFLDNTPEDHPDHENLEVALSKIRTLARAIDDKKNEADQAMLDIAMLRELENLIDGNIELAAPNRRFIRQYPFSELKVAKKDRCLFLFSDLLVCASVKRRSGPGRRQSFSVLSQASLPIDASKYKLNWKYQLEDMEIVKPAHTPKRIAYDQTISKLEEDLTRLNQISGLADSLACSHQALNDVIKELMDGIHRKISDRQTLRVVPPALMNKVELLATTPEGTETMTLVFNNVDLKMNFESKFTEAKLKLSSYSKDYFPPVFLYPIPISKTRSGMQFTCAAPSLGTMSNSLRDVWVCNSDGYVGQVCLLSMTPDPNVVSCISVCSTRILCVMSVPAGPDHSNRSSMKRRPRPRPVENLPPNNSSPVSPTPKVVHQNANKSSFVMNSTPAMNLSNKAADIMAFDSDDSELDEDIMSPVIGQQGPLFVEESAMDEASSDDDVERLRSGNRQFKDCLEAAQPTMWLGTEDGCIHVYQCGDNISTKRKSRAKIRHPASVHCILYIDNKVFISLANGDLTVYKREQGKSWDTCNPISLTIGSSNTPINCMVAVSSKIWCGCHNSVLIVDPHTLAVEHQFTVSDDSQRAVYAMVSSGWSVWVSLQSSAVVRLYHAITYQSLCEVDVTQTVHKMLAGSDAIIRQHKAACLRITSLLICKDLLWVGTSAGVILTVPLPKITSTTTGIEELPTVTGSAQGHTGHVRFLAAVDIPSPKPINTRKISVQVPESKNKIVNNKTHRPVSSAGSIMSNMMVISGGDGYEDFGLTSPNESAGKEDSTNHLLLWQV
ncbi:rho guanine nucleotide exchange factor 17-like [Antedon mediterranea]|uniref:rho guanine nucleotide exchange factor 17-like n=1 Tax=Antedon mediterranea TaxID=105859 RepID=UPI003AF98906